MSTTTPYQARSRLATWFDRELTTHHTMSIVLAGLISGVIVVILQLSFAALVFSGELSVFLPRGIGLTLIGAFIIGTLITLGSSISGIMAAPQDSLAAILALVVPLIIVKLPANTTPEMKFNTVLATIILTTALTGFFFLILGQFKLGDLTRYIPYPVVGGILAGTGWLLTSGAFLVMTDVHPGISNISEFFTSDMLTLWVPGLIYAVAVVMLLRRVKHHLTLPIATLTAIILFFVWLMVSDRSLDEAISEGLLLGDVGRDSAWKPIDFAGMMAVDWGLILQQAGGIVTIVLVSAISLLLNAAGIELTTEQDIDLNQELKSSGGANLIASLFGAFPGYHLLSVTVLTHQMKGASRITGLIAASLSLIVLLVGGDLLRYFPKPVLGGLLLYLGLGFLVEWVYDAYRKLPRADYTVVVLILIFIAAIGFLEGVAVGVVVTIVLFVAKYSRVNVVKYTLSGARHRSNVDRPSHHRRVLSEYGDRLHILKLHGYLFFGTAHNLLNLIRERLNSPDPIQFLVLDFRLVTGLDTSAIISFTKVRRTVQMHGVTLLCTNVPDQVREQLERNGLLYPDDPFIRVFADLDHGLEWCENQLILSAGQSLEDKRETLEMQLGTVFSNSEDIGTMLKYFERQHVEAGKHLIRQGDLANDLFFVETGQVTALLELDGQPPMRLRTMGAGTVVGEIGLYLGDPRSASVVADSTGTVYRLTSEALRQLEHDHPDIASSFHRFMIHLLAERLGHTDAALRMMLQ